jgi:hypothetical protein
MRYIIKQGHAISTLVDISVYGPFNTPEIARNYASDNNLGNYIIDILIQPYQ